MTVTQEWLKRFVAESLAIESIFREPTAEELSVTKAMIESDVVTVADLEALVEVYQPGNVLRRGRGQDVVIGGRLAPAGGPGMELALTALLLQQAQDNGLYDPWGIHVAYECLHPFTDGNGRSGRALWAHMMHRLGQLRPDRLFLQHFYYQTLHHHNSI